MFKKCNILLVPSGISVKRHLKLREQSGTVIVKILNLLYHAFMYSLLLLLSGLLTIYQGVHITHFTVAIQIPD